MKKINPYKRHATPFGLTVHILTAILADWSETGYSHQLTEVVMGKGEGSNKDDEEVSLGDEIDTVEYVLLNGEIRNFDGGLTVTELKQLVKEWEGRPGELLFAKEISIYPDNPPAEEFKRCKAIRPLMHGDREDGTKTADLMIVW